MARSEKNLSEAVSQGRRSFLKRCGMVLFCLIPVSFGCDLRSRRDKQMETTTSDERVAVTGKDTSTSHRSFCTRSHRDSYFCPGLILGAGRPVRGHQWRGSNASGICRGDKDESHLSSIWEITLRRFRSTTIREDYL